MRFFIVLVTLVAFASCAQLPSDFKRCKRSDANLNSCLKEAIQDAFPKMANGIAELSVPPMEPLNIPSATIRQGSGPVNVEQKYKNLNIYKLIDSQIKSVETTKTDNEFTLHAKIFAPECIMKGDYDFNGRILLLPIIGNGKCTINLYDTAVELTMVGEKFEKKGKIYMKIKDFKIDLKPGKVQYKFENLFNGDERLSKEMHNVLNDNWKEVFEDVETGYEELFATIGKLIANNIFTKVPYDDVFLP